jgi:hypothetical protein
VQTHGGVSIPAQMAASGEPQAPLVTGGSVEREQFVAAESPSWWLLEADVDYRIEELRTDLGASFGWTERGWYRERVKLEELYDFIVRHKNDLFYELGQAADDLSRQRWIASVLELRRPPAATSASAPAGPGSSGSAGTTPANGAPPRKSAFGSKSQLEAAAADTTPANPRKSALGLKAQSVAPTTAAGGPAAANAPQDGVPTGDTPARKSIFKAKSQAQPSAAPDDGPQVHPVEAVRTGEHLEEVAEHIQTVMSELSAEDLSAIAEELGLSPEEVETMVHEPDFANLVAEEQTHVGDQVA